MGPPVIGPPVIDPIRAAVAPTATADGRHLGTGPLVGERVAPRRGGTARPARVIPTSLDHIRERLLLAPGKCGCSTLRVRRVRGAADGLLFLLVLVLAGFLPTMTHAKDEGEKDEDEGNRTDAHGDAHGGAYTSDTSSWGVVIVAVVVVGGGGASCSAAPCISILRWLW